MKKFLADRYAVIIVSAAIGAVILGWGDLDKAVFVFIFGSTLSLALHALGYWFWSKLK